MNTDAELLSDLANAGNLIEGQAAQGRKAGAGGAGEGRGAGAGEAKAGDWREERRVRLLGSVRNTDAALLGDATYASSVFRGKAVEGRAAGVPRKGDPVECDCLALQPAYTARLHTHASAAGAPAEEHRTLRTGRVLMKVATASLELSSTNWPSGLCRSVSVVGQGGGPGES